MNEGKKSIAESISREPLLWDRGRVGRSGFSLPKRDVEDTPINEALLGQGPDFPDVSEVDVVRHFTKLSQLNFGVDTGMYPLGSCTMKYNPKINEKQAKLEGFTGAHPLLPCELSQGALEVMAELEEFLLEITGMDAVTLQPAAGAHGELTGMLIMHAYHKFHGSHRTKIIIPDTAHGTNPASAALCGFKTVPVTSGPDGILGADTVAEIMDEETAGIMITNPNTLGLFEEHILKIAEAVHEKGGLVYGDGANMNAIMGIADVGALGIDILHLNLHKTFSTPHGGGGPGSGPVCVMKNLASFLPVPRIITHNGEFALSEDFPLSIGRIHGFYGNFSVMVKALSYILSMGSDLKKASQLAVLNANYIKEKLKDVLHLPFDRPCMHECVFTDRLQQKNKISTLDMAKRLIDYGYHPPTIYFPLVVSGAIMIEPTETESKEEIDNFVEAFKAIAEEAAHSPDLLRQAPTAGRISRLDETEAARHPCLTG
ncbi:MAG: aminomethyl-transferring glycine dehydrogenase subunit GcvPB [Syntrophales bacterium]|jgi:glycine dehydrogenase subunit 2|nr:aminomethyl-transferring glycine dehydrogenase subunit GcvPB [Syntrophales bacterium]MDY0045465.1 aminomethyl-transferring glycine dehydrogenase subunit GcvPB [Syntrophales bacterium]